MPRGLYVSRPEHNRKLPNLEWTALTDDDLERLPATAGHLVVLLLEDGPQRPDFLLSTPDIVQQMA